MNTRHRSAEEQNRHRWLLFFYTTPSKPVSIRMTVWRRLMKAGALHLKGSVYILPFSLEHYEFLHWLVAEVRDMKGDAALVSINGIDTMPDEEIIACFNQIRRADYQSLANSLDEMVTKWNAIRKGGEDAGLKSLTTLLDKLGKSFDEVGKIDFFVTPEGTALRDDMERLREEMRQWGGAAAPKNPQPAGVPRKNAEDYQGRTWITRSRPFVDRMASAWLIGKFIDPQAVFAFVDTEAMTPSPAGSVAFDMFSGEFTHCGELCTFEVLITSFNLRDKALEQLAKIVHDLDIKDNKYQAPETGGVAEILRGIRKTAKDDHEALTQGMQVFETLYAAKTA
ncbi:MAG: chromate resistance protein ChrB domain-containing protein [Thermodesulfobacteriota bacterium]